MAALAPADADMFWHSQYRFSDQVALYCFAAQPGSDGTNVELALRRRIATVDDLAVRVAPAWRDLAFPRWVRRSRPAPLIAHRGTIDWVACTRLVATVLTDGLDPTVTAGAIHLIGPVTGAPRTDGPAWVVLLQVSHALADGRGVAEVARALFGGAGARRSPVVTGRYPGRWDIAAGVLTAPIRIVAGLVAGLGAWRLRSADDSTAGAPVPATALNGAPGERRRVDLIVLDTSRVRIGRYPVTVSVLARLAEALAAYLGPERTQGAPLAVELTVGRPVSRRSAAGRNNFHAVTIDLRPELPLASRAAAIAAQIAAAQVRDRSAARTVERAAAALTPPVLRALAVRLTHADVAEPGTPPGGAVRGALVVSSVNRGPADLTLAGAPAVFTAGFPALSRVHLTSIGVHGLGETVTVSLATDPDRVQSGRLLGLAESSLRRTVES